MSPIRCLAACALLAAAPAWSAEDPPTVEASPRFIDYRARASVGLGMAGGIGPMLSASAIFGQRLAVDISGIAFPFQGVVVVSGAIQGGLNFRFEDLTASGAGQTIDLRLLAGAGVSTAVLESLPPQTVYVPSLLASLALEWTYWASRWLGVSAELAAVGGVSVPTRGVGLRASVGVAF